MVISDRRRVQILKFLRGWAVVQGDDAAHSTTLHTPSHRLPIGRRFRNNQGLNQVVPTPISSFVLFQKPLTAS